MLLCRFGIVVLVSLLFAGALGCESEPEEADVIDDLVFGGGGADGNTFPVTNAALGEVYSGQEVQSLPRGASDDREALATAMKVYRFDVEAGQSFAIAMISTTSSLDSYLLLKDPDYETVRRGYDQAVLPMARETDAVVTYTAVQGGTFYVFATGGQDFTSAGVFDLHFIALDTNPGVDLGVTNASVRSVAASLREREPELTEMLTASCVIEGDDGLIAVNTDHCTELPLSERVEINRLIAAVNSDRGYLFEAFVLSADLDVTPTSTESVARACAQLWRVVRTSD